MVGPVYVARELEAFQSELSEGLVEPSHDQKQTKFSHILLIRHMFAKALICALGYA